MGELVQFPVQRKSQYKPYKIPLSVVVDLVRLYRDKGGEEKLYEYVELLRQAEPDGVPVSEDMYLQILEEEDV